MTRERWLSLLAPGHRQGIAPGAALALKFDGRKHVHTVGDFIACIQADQLIRRLERDRLRHHEEAHPGGLRHGDIQILRGAALSDSDEFRRKSTAVFRAVRIVIMAGVVGLSIAGWLVGGMWGLLIAGVLSMGLAFIALVAAGLLYAMTQDGA